MFERVFPIVATPQDAVNLQEIIPLADRLLEILEAAPHELRWPHFLRICCCKRKKRTSCCCKYTILFGQIKQLGLILKQQFTAEHHWVKTSEGPKLDCMFFRQSRRFLEASDMARQNELDLVRPVFIICNSNAMFYQQMVHLSHTFYLKMFLDKGINVFTWNYRAYGRSQGKPTPENLKKDIMTVYKFIRSKLGLKGKIGIYGRSLGGIPSSFLANHVDMAIIDRSFCNLAAMAKWKYHGSFADYLFKIGSCGWQAQNDYHVLQQPWRETAAIKARDEENNAPEPASCYKVITQDRHDEIIEVQASLMVGIAKEVCLQELKRRGPNWRGTLGILNDGEVSALTSSIHAIIDIEESLYFLI